MEISTFERILVPMSSSFYLAIPPSYVRAQGLSKKHHMIIKCLDDGTLLIQPKKQEVIQDA